MTPYFSVILPIYNVAPYLQRCVQSVLEQSFREFELILVDDGSTDESPEICDQLGVQHECIRVIHKENGGLSSARNAGMEIARGTYIWFVDSDDWVARDALQILFEASSARPDMVKCNYVRAEGREVPFFSNVCPGLYQDGKKLLDAAMLTPGKFCLSAWSHIYRREFLEKNELAFVSERIIGSEDYLFNLQALAVAESVHVIPDQLYFYELRDGSLSQKYKKDLPERYLCLYAKLREFYDRIGLLGEYERKICRFFAWHLIRATCMTGEYAVSAGHTLAEGRENVRRILRIPEVQYAVKRCDSTGLNWKKRIQLLAMRWRQESIFYRMHTKKRGKRETP